MMKKKLLGFGIICLCGMLFSCSTAEEATHERTVNMLSTPQPIELTASQKIFASDNNGFSLNFFKTANESVENDRSMI